MNMKPLSFFDMQTFHLGFPVLGQAIIETENDTQAPDKLVGHCAVNAVFTAVQGLADFKRPDGGSSPVSNISWIVGETGERKSSVDKCFFGAMHDFRAANTVTQADLKRHSKALRDWKAKERVLAARVRKVLTNRSPWCEITSSTWEEHWAKEPQKPVPVPFVYADTSPIALKVGLSNFPTACVHSTDAMSIIEGALFEQRAMLCELYSDDVHYFDRNGCNIELDGRRLCVSAHSQPLRSLAFLRKEGETFRDSGLAARLTVCYIDKSMQGYRTYDAVEIPKTARDRFKKRARHLLEATMRAARRPKFKRRQLTLSPEAMRAYLEFANWVEQQMLPGGVFENLRDYANRLADKVGRLAAALHLFEGYRGEISLSTFQAARSFYDEATKDFQHLFNYLPSDRCLADLLLQWMRNHYTAKRSTRVKKSFILNHTHPSLRNKVALDAALSLLEYQGHLFLEKDRSGTTWVCLGRPADLAWKLQPGWSQIGNNPYQVQPC